MASFSQLVDNVVVNTFELDKPETRIGRRPDNDIQIDNLAVSGKHALVITILDDSFLEDLGSTNGTWCQSEPVSNRRLEPGDIFSIGGMKFMYDDASPDERDELPVVPGLQLRQLVRDRPQQLDVVGVVGRARALAADRNHPHQPSFQAHGRDDGRADRPEGIPLVMRPVLALLPYHDARSVPARHKDIARPEQL